MTKINKEGFRKDITPFFNQFVLSIPTKDRQSTPFLVTDGDTITKVNTVDELLEHKNDVEVLQTWPGKVKSDVFYFVVKDLKDHLKKGGK